MASSDVWSDFEQVRHLTKSNTVDKLKQILSGLNEECGTHIAKSGKKQELIDRIIAVYDSWRSLNAEDKWVKAKGVVYQVRNTGIYTPTRLTSINPSLVSSAMHQSAYTTNGIPKTSTFHTLNASNGTSGTIGRYDPYAPPRKATTSTTPVASSSSVPRSTGIRFKDSPFFTIDQAVSPVVECPESSSATDRRQQILTFTLNSEQIAKLKVPGSKYQLRLFCTSSIFYAGNSVFRSNALPCPIEFPPTCEVRVNNVQLAANLKGLKKKPGTAPPPDLGKHARISNVQNRVEMVYVNSQQPVQSKKFYLVVMLVEVTDVDQLVVKLKSTSYRSSQDIKRKMVESLGDDDDIIAGPQKMSLKCPLSFMRVNTPCRSSKCVHSQCFDATSWYSMMEQTTTWLCPVCERTLDYKDLIIDGYFNEILTQTPESVEDVMVEADGEWHTTDNKYGSATWKALHPVAAPAPPTPRKPPPIVQVAKHTHGEQPNGKGKAPDHEIFVLDSDDDEDEGRVKRELSPSYASSGSHSVPQTQTQTETQVAEDVIDLTLDSEDEEPPMPQSGKRKASDAGFDAASPTEQVWKKGRAQNSNVDRAPRLLQPGNSNGVDHSRQPLIGLPPVLPPPPRYPSNFPGNLLPPVYSNYAGGGGGTANPSTNLYHVSQANGSGVPRW
ncbi:PINIT domain-containing protein [Crucibulum laeve]|uniref:PINIT domain-containing protein n=1 Tax=Crucibulum laeve TaxID=68775 RepID=A0A5C3M9T3_9AGAR|nr:PINIT domain-containing protein [Crucibulum laeve]